MDPDLPDLSIADVVVSTAGRDAGKLFYVIDADESYLTLANGKDRVLEKPKQKKRKHAQKVLRSETRVAQAIKAGDKVLNSELRRDLAEIGQVLQSNANGGYELWQKTT